MRANPKPGEGGNDPWFTALCELEDRIAYIPARTLPGVTAQVRLVVRAQQESTVGEAEEAALRNVLVTLEDMCRQEDAGELADLAAAAVAPASPKPVTA